jgi:hypothetical protein
MLLLHTANPILASRADMTIDIIGRIEVERKVAKYGQICRLVNIALNSRAEKSWVQFVFPSAGKG